MPYDLMRLAREMLGLSGLVEQLQCACNAAAEVARRPTFAVHLMPGADWGTATLAAGPGAARISGPVRSALYAVYRRLSRNPESLHLERSPDCEPVFRALLPEGAALHAVPLRSRSGLLIGALVTGDIADPERGALLAEIGEIAGLASPALESASRYGLARRDQERLQLFSETADEALWDWHVGRDEVWWGGGLERLFAGGAIASKRADWRRMCVVPEDAERIIASFEQARLGKAASWSEQYRLRGAEGASIEVREYVYFLREVDGRAYRAIGSLSDISALRQALLREQQARAEAERASIVKDEFLAMLGHELRNPLAPIIAVLELLEQRAAGPDRALEIFRRQAVHLVRLVDDLLDVSRISSGKIELARQRVSAEAFITQAVEMVSPLIEQRRHALTVEVERSLEVDGDIARLTQVISNLLTNAVRYTDPGGRLQVTARAENAQAVIRIRDNGIGIAPEFLPKVFDLFTQGQQALDRSQGGLGLGLSIAVNIVRLHGGDMAVHSEGAGRGTEVVVRLPLMERRAAALPLSASPADRAAPAARDILIIDDNEDAAEALGELLSIWGHAVRVAHDPAEALRLFAQKSPDIALVDIGLPTMDGYELAGRMRADPNSALTKFVALTGYGQASDKTRAAEAGFHDHAVKPVSADRLAELIGGLAR